MQREELWRIYTRNNPQFADAKGKITLTGAGLRKLFEQTWDQAHAQGFRNGKSSVPTPSIFESVFGRKA